jgi:hypothetical protein
LQLGYGESQMLDKLLYDEEVKRCMACFEQQFHYGVFYAYMKLREQEIRNIMWISECVAQVRVVPLRVVGVRRGWGECLLCAHVLGRGR